MDAIVSRTYYLGKHIPMSKKVTSHRGDLNVSEGKHPVLGRLVKEACLLGENGINVIPPLYDVSLTCIAAKGLRLRGFEVNAGKETAQEWWVQVT